MELCGLVPRGLLRAACELAGRGLLHPLHQPGLVVEGADRWHEGFGHRIRKQKHPWFERSQRKGGVFDKMAVVVETGSANWAVSRLYGSLINFY